MGGGGGGGGGSVILDVVPSLCQAYSIHIFNQWLEKQHMKEVTCSVQRKKQFPFQYFHEYWPIDTFSADVMIH